MQVLQAGLSTDATPLGAAALVRYPCMMCGSETFAESFAAGDYEYRLPGIFYVARCARCGLWQQSPRPEFNDILRYYSGAYAAYTDPSGFGGRLKMWAITAPRLNVYRKLVGPNARIVDLGCGSGSLMAALMSAGFTKVVGVETNAEAVAAGQARGLDIRLGTLEDAAFADGSFDLITMNHVLEHVPDPRATLAELRRVLAPGGVLSGEVPNLDCLERRTFGRYWAGYHLPRHISFFERKSLTAMLTQSDFTVVSMRGKMQPANWLVSMSSCLADRGSPRAKWFDQNSIAWLAVTTPVAWLLNILGSSPSLRFAARKP